MNVLLKTRSALRSCWGLLTAPEPGVPGPEPLAVARRGPARELLVALAMALLTAGVEELMDAGALAMALSAASAFGLWLLRRRLPATVLILMSALGAAFAGFALMQMFVAWSAGRRIALPGRALAAFAVSYLLYLGTGLAEIGMWARQSPVALTMFGTLAFLAMVVVPGLTSRYWSQRRTLLHALQERNTQLVWEHQMVAGQARLLERQRIAQDMHDSLGHQLALIAVHTGALEVDTSLTERQREAVGVLRNASVTAMHELREVVGILRDGIEGTPPPADGAGPVARGTAGIDTLVADARGAGHTVRLRRTGPERPLAAAAGHAAYRIVQESLTNAYKHAPGARIDVELRYEPDSLVVEIASGAASRGPAADVVSGGQGLTGLRERARLVGGIVHAGPTDDGGFRVAGVLPYGSGDTAHPVPGPAPSTPWAPPAPGASHHSGAPLPFGVPYVPGAPYAPGTAVPGGGVPWVPHPPHVPSRFSGVGLGCGITAGAVLAVGVLIVAGFVLLVRSMSDEMVSTATYDDLSVGVPEAEARERLPDGEHFLHEDIRQKGEAPAAPAGASCLVVVSEEMSSSWSTEAVFRFCFKDGRLIEKKSYEVKI
ncbi:histidine kinase [Streptomyces uncialis]|uniref:histidine kinase n=1 Tax=Streptomyces uncialis TaxID=1048205 RepID=UPI0022514522|nr:histidine kinase [Streptomyces uncialis]MCX4657798.1 histidine kinase [Streptomyces uncialis]